MAVVLASGQSGELLGMVFFNWATMQMAAKIVYYGPGLCGKTTNLSYIYAKTSPNSRGEMVSLETESDRTLFFDLLPIEVGTIGGFKTRLQLYTVPGQVFYNTTRKLVLKGVDGVVFVADSQRPMREANIESLKNLRTNLAELGLDMDETPVVLQYNKRDLKNILSLEELDADLNAAGRFAFHESSAITGDGVFETLKEITKLTLKKLRRRMAAPQPAAAPRVPVPAAAARAGGARAPASVSAAALARAAEEGVDVEASERPFGLPPAAATVGRSPAIPFPARQGPSPPEPEPESAPEPAAQESAGAPPDAVTAPNLPDHEEPQDGADVPLGAEHEIGEEELAEVAPSVEEPEELTDADMVVDEEDEEAAAATAAIPVPRESIVGEAESVPEEPAAVAAPEPESGELSDPDLQVEFEQDDAEAAEVEPPPMKHVHVSNQMDILAELESLRKQATMANPSPRKAVAATPSMDLDSLLAGDLDHRRELRRKVAERVNSGILARLRRVRVAVQLQGDNGEALHELEPFALTLEGDSPLEKLCLLLTIDLESMQ